MQPKQKLFSPPLHWHWAGSLLAAGRKSAGMGARILTGLLLTVATTGAVADMAESVPAANESVQAQGAATDPAAAITAAPDMAAPNAANSGTVTVTIDGIASTDGLVYASLFISADGFPDVLDKAAFNKSVAASESSGGTLVMNFAAVPAGVFAISVMHDADADGKLDTNFMGIPSEDYGFSQNPKAMFGPPSFDKAAVALNAGETRQLIILLK